ncbi:electron transport complex subunit RsxC [Myxococcota bacterium]|nr:electron transport complex subunit RsxC [Myxococcota bacterium]MBU1431942.1 electron transport complex subunit RsxC [Myxococcota bacterium]MBU1897166.1 electron transport complex subunit RsxC [Myxococcota bacterium]
MNTATTPATGTFPRGVHPPEGKRFAEDQAIEVLPSPPLVLIPVQQHIGAPCAPTVKPRAKVQVGDVIADVKAFISAPIHASLNGVAAKPVKTTLPNGRRVEAIPITAAGEQLEGRALFEDVYGGEWPRDLSDYEPSSISQAARAAGIVGQGGAAFPTAVKLMKNAAKPVDTILLNGAECEPYLTADYRLMLEAADAIICGLLLAGHATGAKELLIGIEDNKPKAIAQMKVAAEGTPVRVIPVQTKYPQGGEKQLIYATTGRVVPTGGLPLDKGVVVLNVGTAAALARAVVRGKPLTHRVVTLSGAGIKTPKNVLAPVGVSHRALIDFCGGLQDNAARVISGGPMMGFTLGDLDAPITKGTSGITILTHQDVAKAEETSCVRCGRCVDVCPLNLVPTRLALAARYRAWDVAKRYHLNACIECGSCAFACPAQIPLVQLIRLGKAQMPKS